MLLRGFLECSDKNLSYEENTLRKVHWNRHEPPLSTKLSYFSIASTHYCKFGHIHPVLTKSCQGPEASEMGGETIKSAPIKVVPLMINHCPKCSMDLIVVN